MNINKIKIRMNEITNKSLNGNLSIEDLREFALLREWLKNLRLDKNS